ncbi:unnamed protein product [Leptidea sinapis]|nr:unnamed protein product [Leptidea sinapis]
MALMSMVLLKLNKKMDTSEAKIKSTQAKIPFGLYTSPEFKCLGTSYYIASAHNQEDVQMILSSERKPHCYTFRGAFAFSGFYHRHSETTYVGPHAEQFQAKDPSQGLYCQSDDNWSDAQCIYKSFPNPWSMNRRFRTGAARIVTSCQPQLTFDASSPFSP